MSIASNIRIKPYSPDRSFSARLKRRVIQWRRAKPIDAPINGPVVSFSFDDFPRTAADTGARIIESVGGRATYYACTGLSGTTNHMGDIFLPEDLHRLTAAGHEIGAHSDGHLDMFKADPDAALADIAANIEALRQMGHQAPVDQFAYPYGETIGTLKRRLVGQFVCARGILPGVNGQGSDLMQLRAVEIGDPAWMMDRAKRMLENCIASSGWVIFFTHDVRERPSSFGISPNALTHLAQLARDSGARILPVGQVIR